MAEVSKAEFSIAYNGDGRLDDHTMDIELLGPALMGIGKLIREVNSEFNGKKSKAEVRVVSDFEHKCFQINFDTVVTYWEQIKSFLDSSDVKSAKEIIEWTLMLGGATGIGGYISFLGYLKIRDGRRVVNQRQYVDHNGEGMVAVTFDGDHNAVEVHQHIYELGGNKRALAAARDAMSPIGRDGFTRIEVKKDGALVEAISTPDAESILASIAVAVTPEEVAPDEELAPITTAWLTVYSPVFDEKAANWRFTLGTDHIYADISETNIAKEALQRGGSMVDDTYQVRLEITEPEGGKGKPSYKILEVLRFIPAPPQARQIDFVDDAEAQRRLTEGKDE